MIKQNLRIDMVSDIACPWCLIGKKQLEASIQELKGEMEIELHMQPFQLDPNIGSDGEEWTSYFENKFGSIDRIDSIFHRVESAGKQVGIKFAFKSIPVIPNTFNLHLLIQACKDPEEQLKVKEALFEAYMIKPVNLTDTDQIVLIMKGMGWSTEKTLNTLNDAELRKTVKDKIKYYQQKGVTGVPFFIINQTYGISGAQPKEVLVEAFRNLEVEMNKGSNSCDLDKGIC